MATAVSTFDWNTSIKPLLAASHNNFSFSADLFKLVRSIESSKQEILQHEAEFEPFYSSFVALSAHYISSNFSQIPKNEMQSVLTACQVCIDFILSRLEKHYDQTSVTSKQLLLLVKGLCKGYGCLQRSDAIKLTAVMKSFQLPPGVRATIGTEKTADESPIEAALKAVARCRSDPLSEIVDYFSSPLITDVSASRSFKEKSPKDKKEHHQAKPGDQAKDAFAQENTNYLLRKNAGSLLIDVCLKLPFLSRYNLMTRDLFHGNMTFTTDINECLAVQDLYASLRADIAAVSVVVTLPLLEPLNNDKLAKLCIVGCSCLLAACSVTVCNHVLSAATNDPKSIQEYEIQANRVLEKSLFVFKAVISIIQNSHNTGGSHLQNFRLLGSWCLLVGVRHIIQNYEIDSALIALGQHLLDLLKPILIDLRTDPGKVEDLTELNINTQSTAWQKVKFLNQRLNIISILLELAAQSFSKALSIRRKPKSVTDLASKDGHDPIPDIDQSIDDMLQNSGLGAPSDTEAETLLGNWLEEVMASVPPLIDSGYLMATERRRQSSLDMSCLGSSSDPALYLNFAVGCLSALNDYIFSGTCNDFSNETFGFSWSERELSQLANMIRLIEQLSSQVSNDTNLQEINVALIRFTHNLLANCFLSGKEEASLLAKLSLLIGNDLKDEWPLQLSPRLLGVLGQILLKRQSRFDKAEVDRLDKDAVIVNIWERLIRTLQSKIFIQHDTVELVDITVDHLQLLLVLFNSLSLMSKKTVFLNTMLAISKTAREGQLSMSSKSDKKIKYVRMSSHFSRLLLIFDYMTRYFYEPPAGLLEQVKMNVYPLQFRSTSESSDKNAKLLSQNMPRSYFSCSDFEEIYRSATPVSQQCKMKPLFYNLAPETSITDSYKLDGLATSFMLNYNEYSDVYESLIEILTWDRIQGKFNNTNDPSNFTAFINGVYSFTSRIMWRMLTVLPPSISALISLKDLNASNEIDGKTLLLFLRFGSRLSDQSCCNWIKDSLCKQKQSLDEANEIITVISSRINTPKFFIDLFTVVLKAKMALWDSLPRISGKSFRRYSVAEMIATDLLLSKFYLFLSKHGETDTFQKEFGQQMNTVVELMNQLTSKYHNLAKLVIIDEASRLPSDALDDTESGRNSIYTLMSVSVPCIGGDLIYDFGISCWTNAHSSVRFVMADWNTNEFSSHGFPTLAKSDQSKGDAGVDGFLSALYNTHLRIISESGFTLMTTVQRLLYSSVFLLLHVVKKFRPTIFDLELCRKSLIPLLVDISANYFTDDMYEILTDKAFYGSKSDEELFLAINQYVCSISYDLIIQRCDANDNAVSPNITDVIVTYFESLLDKNYGREAVASVLEKIGDINFLLRATFSQQAEDPYKLKLIRLLTAVFKAAEAYSFQKSLAALSEKIIQAVVEEFSLFDKWLNNLSNGSASKASNTENNLSDAHAFLVQLTKYLQRSSSIKAFELNKLLLESLIILFDSITNRINADYDSSDTSNKTQGRVLCEFFYIMVDTASAKTSSPYSHVLLLRAVVRWIAQLKSVLCSNQDFAKRLVSKQKDSQFFDFIRVLFSYLSEALFLFRKHPQQQQMDDQMLKIVYDSDISGAEPENEQNDDSVFNVAEDESADESEEDTFDNKLCTFTLTQKEFMSQHWYHCHTCGMVDGEGVCTICAKVCHKGHDLSYSKFGSFFCDCGAKGGCQAMMKRVKQKVREKSSSDDSTFSFLQNLQVAPFPYDQTFYEKLSLKPGGRIKRTGGRATGGSILLGHQKNQPKIIIAFSSSGNNRETFYNELAATKKTAIECILEMLKVITPIVAEFSKEKSALGFSSKLRNDLMSFHTQKKSFDSSESLAIATLASQDGAFENLKLTLTGDVGQTIKHLISSHIIQRVAICCLSGFDQKKQLLAVAHDRSKITVMHVSALLKQAEGSQKKLTLTRTCSESLPFVVLSMADNSLSNEFLAVCGFKELHVITLSQSGLITDRLVLQPPLEGGNYILKALWVPSSLTKLAAVTADYVRIYDLSLGSSQTIFHFMLAAGKICDATFVCWERKKDNQRYLDIYLILLSNSGHLYVQQISENFEYAIHGALFITATIDLRHSELTENAGVVAQGGSSVYFSTKLQTIFVSFSNGKSFFFPLTRIPEVVDNMFLLSWRSSMKSLGMQPLYRWAEPFDHPGIMTALTHSSQNPIIFMLKPNAVLYQELVVPSKAKVIDCVPIRYCSSYGEKKSVVALIGEDGGLRIFSINLALADNWLPKPSLLSHFAKCNNEALRKRHAAKIDKLEPPPFQVDFFESCQQLTNVEYGGNDLLQIYNYQLLKDRLEKNNTYVACAKVNGFQVEILNNDGATVMCGLRIELGKKSVQKTPMYFEVFGRRQMVNISRGRWFDFPFSREETINAANRVTVTFGPSRDESKVNFVDSMKVYGKTRDNFGWNDDLEEYVIPSNETEICASDLPPGKIFSSGRPNTLFPSTIKREFLNSEQMIVSFFAALEAYFSIFSEKLSDFRRPTVDSINSFFVTTMHPETLRKARLVLRQVLPSRADYYATKDYYILSYVSQKLQKLTAPVDPEFYCLLISLIRNVCVFRPTALNTTNLTVPKMQTFVEMLTEKFWLIFNDVPLYSRYAAVGYGDVNNCDVLVRVLVEILHAVCLSDRSATFDVSKAYSNLLFSKHFPVAFACRSALIAVFRKNVKVPAPVTVTSSSRSVPSTSRQSTATDSVPASSSNLATQQQQQDNLVSSLEIVDEPPHGYDLVNISVSDQDQEMQDALLIPVDNGQPSHAHLYDLPSDADDEQHLVEIAIALSLQDQSGASQQGAEQNALIQALQQESMDQDQGHSSDTTASGMSDEEGSNAATEGSTLRISPAEAREPRDSPESDSPASVSGRSSTVGGSDPGITTTISLPPKDVLPLVVQTTRSRSSFDLDANKLKNQQVLLELIDDFTQHIKDLDKRSGFECISFLQVLATLVSSIGSIGNNEKNIITRLTQTVIDALRFKTANTQRLCERSHQSEVSLLLLRFLSVLLSKGKGTTKSATLEADMYISTATSKLLIENEAISYCLRVLKDLTIKMTEKGDAEANKPSKKMLTPHSDVIPPDFSPMFVRSYVKEHSLDIFERYHSLLAEIVLRLPYQIKKVAKSCSADSPLLFEDEWNDILCDLMRDQSPEIKKDVRKLLLFLSATRERYRSLRDLHTFRVHLKLIRNLCAKFKSSAAASSKEIDPNRKLIMNYSVLNNMMDYLKVMLEIAVSRPSSWQNFSLSDKGALIYLVQLSCVVDDSVAVVILSLVQMSVGMLRDKKKISFAPGRREEREKFKFSDLLAAQISEMLLDDSNIGYLENSAHHFLFSCNSSECRWQMHALLQAILESWVHVDHKVKLVRTLWNRLWVEVPFYGRKAAQFIDLLSYYSAKLLPVNETRELLNKVLELLKTQNVLLTEHPNAYLYNSLASLLEFDGYYLETNPCLVCNNPEVPMTNVKLNSLKMDARFTTTSQMMKLVSSHEISRIILKISEARRSKTVKQIKLYYSNKLVPSAVELKNKPDIWSLAKTFTLSQSQSELKMEFAIPIVACNLMMEYSDFYEIPSATPEALHCPRCSASVPANPGVCSNCNENVYQCHKCRAINYDEKDPFLCNSCGYSKYGKFDFTVFSRIVAGVEPIENEEDRKKTMAHINTLLEKADQLYRQLLVTRPHIETLLSFATGQDSQNIDDSLRIIGGTDVAIAGLVSGLVNRSIQLLAIKYNRDCRLAFEDLSKIVQKLIANKNELIEYDRKQRELSGLPPLFSVYSSLQSSSDCFGCAAATAQQCILMARALTISPEIRQSVSNDPELISQLIEVALKQNNVRGRQASRELICSITKDQKFATKLVCDAIESRVAKAMAENTSSTLSGLVHGELQLLFATLQISDDCWEMRIRTVFKLLLRSLHSGQASIEAVTLPCLNVFQSMFIMPTSKESPEKSKSISVDSRPKMNVFSWLTEGESLSYVDFLGKLEKADKSTDAQLRRNYLLEKYGRKWLKFKFRNREPQRSQWLDKLLFCLRSSQTRNCTAYLLEQLCNAQPMRKAILLDMLTGHLSNLEQFGDRAHDFVNLYQNLVKEDTWKLYLVVRKILPLLGHFISQSVENLNKLEGKSLNTDMSQGYALKVYCDLLLSFLQVETVRKNNKKQLLDVVLHSYLGLKRLLIQRTKLIDDAQSKLLQLLELLTTGTEAETEEFIKICIRTAKKYPIDDLRTPLFIFERLCSTVHPEEKEVGEFLMNVEKDAAQDDFLQGRMMGNPYKSSDAGMGPLMRDIKNKICRDCDLISLLEDDTGMELLVNSKIISLDLPVSEVYKKIWQPNHPGETMLIVYRMRGLLGDATEEFVESLQSKKTDKVNEEEAFKRGKIVGECGGLELMLERFKNIKSIHISTIVPTLLNLFDYCIRVRDNRIHLLDSKIHSIEILLRASKTLLSSNEPEVIGLGEKTLGLINRILAESESVPENEFKKFCDEASASDEDFQWLLTEIYKPNVQSNNTLKEAMLQTIVNLTLGSAKRTKILIQQFESILKFELYDAGNVVATRTAELEAFCFMSSKVQVSKYGLRLKDKFKEDGFVSASTSYLVKHCPPLFKVGSTLDSPDWKEFLAKPSLKYVLRMLAGLCQNHETTQLFVAEECIPIIHRLEQISSEERVGSLAENLMEVLKTNTKVAKKIEEVREETKTKKRNLAMAMRQKQLTELGMTVSEKGQVRSDAAGLMKNVGQVSEEPGLTCSICQEGYKLLPQKLLGIYTFTKRCNCDDFEAGPKKTPAFSTVSHFNAIHFDCHTAGVRSARGRDEWESATLQNANTKCNGLLPVHGTQIADADFAAGLAKHQVYIQDHTGIVEINFNGIVHDLKLLLLRFANEKSFSEEAGGGGRESNIHLLPYLAYVSFYSIVQTQAAENQTARLTSFVNAPAENWVKNAFEVEGATFYTTLALILCYPDDWNRHKVNLLRRLIVTAQARNVSPDGSVKQLKDKTLKPYKVYKPYLIFFGLVDKLYAIVFEEVKVENSKEWPAAVQKYIRANDAKLIEKTTKVLKNYEEQLLPCETFVEFVDVAGLFQQIPNPDEFFNLTLTMVP